MQRYSVPFKHSIPLDWSIYYQLIDGQLKLVVNGTPLGERAIAPISIDLISMLKYHLRQNYSIKREPFFKALGLSGNERISVVDATCGMAQDSMLILSVGAIVTSYERSNILIPLILDGVERMRNGLSQEVGSERAASILERFQFCPADLFQMSSNSQVGQLERPQVIYLDPMYSSQSGRHKAQSNIRMRLLQQILAPQDDENQLLVWAQRYALKRVVVKRALRADPLGGVTPHHTHCGKSTRYDVYC
ncbi:MAG: class I SAM-dependent methyltransferase [Bdellovibrionales bacterium]|nr:class I SAM-dependent methyltransferase [Bdellovibrionales bacterium]